MKKMLKFLGFGFLGLIVLVIIIGAISDSTDVSKEEEAVPTSTQPKEESPKTEEVATKEVESEPKEKVVAVGVGQPLTVGDVSFTVSKVGEETMLGDQYFNETPTEGAVYKMVDMTIQNGGAEALTIDSTYFKLIVDGVEYSPTTSTVLIDQMFFLEQINPKLSKKGILIFEVPQGTTSGQLHVQTGFWGTETGVINLQ